MRRIHDGYKGGFKNFKHKNLDIFKELSEMRSKKSSQVTPISSENMLNETSTQDQIHKSKTHLVETNEMLLQDNDVHSAGIHISYFEPSDSRHHKTEES